MAYLQTKRPTTFTPTEAETLGLSHPSRRQRLAAVVALTLQTQVHIPQIQVRIRQTQVHILRTQVHIHQGHIRQIPTRLVTQMYGRSTGRTLHLEARSSLFVPVASECSAGDMLTPDQRMKGEINFKTNDILFDVWILGYPLETAGGNLDTGVWVNVNLVAAKGYLKIYDVPGEPKDQIWMLADLHLPFRQHFYKNIHMFNIPHHGPPPNKQVSTA